MSLAGPRLDSEEWTHTRFGTVKTKLPRLPPAPGAEPPEAATADLDDASLTQPTAPPHESPRSMAKRPKRRIVTVGGPTSSAVAREVAELRREREVTEVMASLGRGGASPRLSAASTSLQGAANRHYGLSEPRPPPQLAAAPPTRLGYTHDDPQPSGAPHVAMHALDAEVAGVVPLLGHDMWANRSVAPPRGHPAARALDGIINGPEALVMGEVEQILSECGVSAELIADAGLSAEEAKRLVNALYVHSSGFQQMLADTFYRLPHRDELLQKVWAGYATLLERASPAADGDGEDGCGYKSVMAAQQRDAEQKYAELLTEFRRVAASMEEELATARAEVGKTEALRVEQSERAAAAEELAASIKAEREKYKLERTQLQDKLSKEEALRYRVEAKLDTEQRNLVPLRAQAAALSGARSEAQMAQALAERRMLELHHSQEQNAMLDGAVHTLQVGQSALRIEMRMIDEALAGELSSVFGLRIERDELRHRLDQELKKLEQMSVSEKSKREAEKEKLKKMIAQCDETEGRYEKEKRQRVGLEAQVVDLQEAVGVVEDEVKEKDEVIASKDGEIERLTQTIGQRDLRIAELLKERDDERTMRGLAKKEQEIALAESAASQTKCHELLDQVSKVREEAKVARQAMEMQKIEAWRDSEALRMEVQSVALARDAAVARCNEQEKLKEENAAQLEEVLQSLEKARAYQQEREEAHQDQLLAQQQREILARKQDEQVAEHKRRAAIEDGKNLEATIASVGALGKAFEALRADVALLTSDNECFTVELAAQTEALNCLYELKSTTGVALASGEALSVAEDETYELLALQADQQRALDGAYRDLAAASEELERLALMGQDELQPAVDDAARAMAELPLVQEELEQSCLVRGDTLAELRMVREAADDEAHQHMLQMNALSKQAAQASDAATYQMKMQTQQLEQLRQEVAESAEELHNWRNGNIRLSNAKQWREERRTVVLPGDASVSTAAANFRQTGSEEDATSPGGGLLARKPPPVQPPPAGPRAARVPAMALSPGSEGERHGERRPSVDESDGAEAPDASARHSGNRRSGAGTLTHAKPPPSPRVVHRGAAETIEEEEEGAGDV